MIDTMGYDAIIGAMVPRKREIVLELPLEAVDGRVSGSDGDEGDGPGPACPRRGRPPHAAPRPRRGATT